MGILGIDLDLLTPAERRDLANALLRAAWSAALEDTRVLLLDLLIEVDEAVVGGQEGWPPTAHRRRRNALWRRSRVASWSSSMPMPPVIVRRAPRPGGTAGA